jgi:outer membrane protein assembly factor BamA
MVYSIKRLILFSILLYPLLAQVTFEGRRQLNTTFLNLSQEANTNPATGQIRSQVMAALAAQGFAWGRIDSVVRTPEKALKIYLTEGPRAILKEINGLPDSLHFVVTDDLPAIYNPDQISQNISDWLARMQDLGYAMLQLETQDIALQSLNADTVFVHLTMALKNTSPSVIHKFQVFGNTYTKDNIVLRELDWAIGETLTPATTNGIRNRLNKLRIFETIEEPGVVVNDSVFTVAVTVAEGQSTTFDGIIGYVPGTAEDANGYFTGLVDINFKNLFGTARKFSIHWQKPDEESDEFRLYYKEPWLLGFPLNGGIQLDRRVQDTLFLEQGLMLEIEYPIGNSWDIYGRYENRTVDPDSLAAIVNGIPKSARQTYVTGLRYENIDIPVNPRNGIRSDIRFAIGTKRNEGPEALLRQDTTLERSTSIQKIELEVSVFSELFRNQVLALQAELGYVQLGSGIADDGDRYWFGGATSLRGYRERQFRSDKYAILKNEYRFITGRYSRVFAFTDVALFNFDARNQFKTGYGFGVRFETGLGVLAVDYGLAAGDSFGSGKIHVGIANDF